MLVVGWGAGAGWVVGVGDGHCSCGAWPFVGGGVAFGRRDGGAVDGVVVGHDRACRARYGCRRGCRVGWVASLHLPVDVGSVGGSGGRPDGRTGGSGPDHRRVGDAPEGSDASRSSPQPVGWVGPVPGHGGPGVRGATVTVGGAARVQGAGGSGPFSGSGFGGVDRSDRFAEDPDVDLGDHRV